jgi:hypothetical protein
MSEAAFSFIDRLLAELKGFECVVPHTFRSLLEGNHASIRQRHARRH